MDAKTEYRIKLQNGNFLNAGTGLNSWFTLQQAYILRAKNTGSQIRWITKYGDMGETM